MLITKIDPLKLDSVLKKIKENELNRIAATPGLLADTNRLAAIEDRMKEMTEVVEDISFVKKGMHQTWENQIGNQVVEPLYYYKPTALMSNTPKDETTVVGILQNSLATGNTVKAAGSGHSYSDVATTPDFFIDTHGLNKIAASIDGIQGQLSQSMLKSTSLTLAVDKMSWPDYNPEANRALFETEAGITIKDLNTALSNRGVGLMNMGGYDGQTIMGAISTSTHGSGISLTPFPDMLRSLVLVTTGKWNGTTFGSQNSNNPGVYIYRIEPKNGITDSATYSDTSIQLIQDDDCFNSVICNMGCMGVVYSIVLEVMQEYWLCETRTITTFDKVLAMLSSPSDQPGALPTALANTRNLEVLVHPYPMNGLEVVEMDPNADPSTYYQYFKCLVTERNIVPKGTTFPDTKPRDFLVMLLSMFDISFEFTVLLLNTFPRLTPIIVDTALTGLVDTNFVQISYEIYNCGLNGNAGFAAEIGFPLQDNKGGYTNEYFKKAVDKIHMIGQNARINGEQYQTSPFSLRFVKSSNAHLSMMEGMNTCMIEMDMITGTYGGPEIMMRYQNNMYQLGGRPHWGLEFCNLSGANNFIADMYPKLDTWMGVYNQFNSEGTFNNRFTDRVGFTQHQFNR